MAFSRASRSASGVSPADMTTWYSCFCVMPGLDPAMAKPSSFCPSPSALGTMVGCFLIQSMISTLVVDQPVFNAVKRLYILRHNHILRPLQPLLYPLRLRVKSLHPIFIARNILLVLIVYQLSTALIAKYPTRSEKVPNVETVEGLAALRTPVSLLGEFLQRKLVRLGEIETSVFDSRSEASHRFASAFRLYAT